MRPNSWYEKAKYIDPVLKTIVCTGTNNFVLRSTYVYFYFGMVYE